MLQNLLGLAALAGVGYYWFYPRYSVGQTFTNTTTGRTYTVAARQFTSMRWYYVLSQTAADGTAQQGSPVTETQVKALETGTTTLSGPPVRVL